ncbi:FAD-dependent oxidoreductase [Psychromarinibacter sp. S121]|uniref:FAD-dependent oxidoreductase n=1 Tax=Psychromarinibacter sp. S121 TaxID=3415127 RepID=UPI003C7A2714
MTENRVLIAGAGPVGMVAAARLVQAGIPVTVFEAGSDLSTQSRASTFHPPTLDMLAELGVADKLIEQGLAAPYVQYRSRSDGLLGRFDFSEIGDLTGHPYRLQCEQWRLCRALLEKLTGEPDFEICFDSPVKSVAQDDAGVTITLGEGDAARTRTGRWLIGADGASSVVRQTLGIGFEGFTWAERFLVVTTTADLRALVPDLDTVTYVADPEQWNFFLEIPTAWRVMFPVPQDMSDEQALEPGYGDGLLRKVLPETEMDLPVEHRTLYRVHQRVADTFQQGRIFLAGDAAHINNPLGGMGMNGGIHDAVNLTGRMVSVWNGDAGEEELTRYDLQRRQVTEEHVQTITIQNKRDLEAKTSEDRAAYRDAMARRMEDADVRRTFLQRIGMFNSLARAAELG